MPPRLPTPPNTYSVQDQAALRRELESAISKIEAAASNALGIGTAPADETVVTHTTDARLPSSRATTDTAEVTWDKSVAGQIKAVIAAALARLGIAQTWTALQTFAAAILVDTGSNDSPARFKTSAAGVGPIVRWERTAATLRVWQVRLGSNGRLQFVDETGGVLVCELDPSATTLLSNLSITGSGAPLVVAGAVGNVNAQDSGVNTRFVLSVVGNSGKGQYIQLSESAVADKWAIGCDAGSSVLRLKNGLPSAADKVTIDSTGAVSLLGGDLTLSRASSDVYGNFNGDNGRKRGIELQTSGANRWRIIANPDSEAGSDTGSNLSVRRFSDAGTEVEAFRITRSSGAVHVGASATNELGNPMLEIHGGTGGAGTGRTGSLQVDATNRNLNIGAWNGLAVWTNVGDEAAPTTGVKALAADTGGNLTNHDGNAIPGVIISGAVASGTAIQGTLWCQI